MERGNLIVEIEKTIRLINILGLNLLVENQAISIGILLEEKIFDAICTRIFFEEVLTDGRSSQCTNYVKRRDKELHMKKDTSLILKSLKSTKLEAIEGLLLSIASSLLYSLYSISNSLKV